MEFTKLLFKHKEKLQILFMLRMEKFTASMNLAEPIKRDRMEER